MKWESYTPNSNQSQSQLHHVGEFFFIYVHSMINKETIWNYEHQAPCNVDDWEIVNDLGNDEYNSIENHDTAEECPPPQILDLNEWRWSWITSIFH